MINKRRVMILTSFMLGIILACNIANSQAATRGFDKGDIFTWGFETSQTSTIKHLLEDKETTNSIQLLVDKTYELTTVDTLAREVTANVTDFTGIISEETFQYGVLDNFGADAFSLYDAFDFSYDWDFVLNHTVLTGFGFDINYPLLIDPDWERLNPYLKNMFDVDEYIWDIPNPYNTSIVYNITFGELLYNATSFKIMGVKNDLTQAKTKFTDLTYKWSFEFDYSNVLYYPEGFYNETTGDELYHPYEKYLIRLDVEYTEDGILQKYDLWGESSITINNVTKEILFNSKIQQGGIGSISAGFSPIVILPSLFLLVIVMKVRRKQK